MQAIYSILNKLTNDEYIGSAISFYRRKEKHLNLLRNNKHHSQYLQNAWNKYKEENFIFLILEEVKDKEKLIEREQFWFNSKKPKYNILKVAGSVLGFRHSEKTKEKLRNNNWQGIFGTNNPFSKKCYQYDLEGNFLKEWESISQIERELNLSNSLIVRCLKGKTKTAHKFQWFYEYQGEKIESRIVKQRKNLYIKI